jgi:hypothetical protein
LKGLVVLLCALFLLGLSACGGGGGGGQATATGPLTILQRAPNADDAPGSKPDPVETTQTATTQAEFVEKMGDFFVNPTKQEKQDFLKSDFVQAIRSTRFFPASPGAAHSKDDAHVFAMVMQFKTPASATHMADLFHTDGLRPCPESCAYSVSEFDVSGIPGATGVRRYASAADIQAAGTTKDRPYDAYEISFSDGDFAYNVRLGGPPGTTSEDKAKEIAQDYYDRVAGRPAAG